MIHAHRFQKLSLFAAVTLCVSTAWAQKAVDDAKKLDAAIAVMRNVDPAKLSPAEKDAMSSKLDHAWNTLMDAGDRGRERVLKELKMLDDKHIKDDYFKLDASKLLYLGWKFDAAGTIAEIWRTMSLDSHYDQIFHIAFDAARTGDARALPMIKALLKDDRNHAFVPMHSMTVEWPLGIEFIWGVYGPDGCPALLEELKTTKNPVVMKSCVDLLAKAQYLKALPAIREVARKGPIEARLFSIEWLGEYGHPDDRAFLLSGLKSSDSKIAIAHMRGLALYDDLSAASAVGELLKRPETDVRRTALQVMACMPGVDAIRALHDYGSSTDDADERKFCLGFVNEVLTGAGVDYDRITSMPKPEADAKLLEANPYEARMRLQPGDKSLSHDELKEACRDWISRSRITGGKFAWVESRHVLATATPKDVKRLVAVRAAVYRRLSDECLYEVNTLDELIWRIGRTRYRKVPGLCAHVEALSGKASKSK